MKTMPSCLLAALCAAGAGASTRDDEKKPVPLYTNDDLRRVAPYRDETGVSSTPAEAPAVAPAPAKSRARGEDYWRGEADRLRDRLRPLRERAAELRFSLPRIVAGERRLRALDERIREAESRLEDRARREGALPGWLR